MSQRTQRLAARVGSSVESAVREQLELLERSGLVVDYHGLGARLVASAADVVIAETQLHAAGTSALARRIGPVYAVEDLTRWLPPPGSAALTGEAVRKRAKQRRLVGFRTDDRHWAFPAWQFDRLGGRLVPRDDVVGLWRRLPTDGFLTDVDLAAWMATRFVSLDGTPAEHAHQHGVASEPLRAAVSRLTARAA
ncbi:hypothetical protein BH20ACT5_BH20ACT5_04460 [soil metagenome]